MICTEQGGEKAIMQIFIIAHSPVIASTAKQSTLPWRGIWIEWQEGGALLSRKSVCGEEEPFTPDWCVKRDIRPPLNHLYFTFL